ncbi:ORF6C domain-containing protein [Listeria aquatica]|uniref:ORF6C domain-containing protein n=1 Tax=Listeria aquatica TaxID=1494960 RepID=UPI003F6EB58B
MYQITPDTIEKDDERVLTTEQLADFYGCSERAIKQNFNNNKNKFIEGKHYYYLEGAELVVFKNSVENFDLVGKNARQLYLWTKRGASRHSKMLGTERAWDMYDQLEESYFNQNHPPMSIEQMMIYQLQEMQTVKTDVAMLKDTMRIDGNQQYTLKETGKKRALSVLGGYQSKAYEAISKKVFSQMWRDFKKQFMIPRYGDLSKKDFEAGMDFLNMWLPETSVRLEIKNLNQQENLFND